MIRQIRKLAEVDDHNFSQYIIIILKRHVQQSAYRGKQKKEKSSSTDSNKLHIWNIIILNMPDPRNMYESTYAIFNRNKPA